MTWRRSEATSLTRAGKRSAATHESLEESQGYRLGATADLVHRSHARRAAGRTRAGLERLHPTGEKIGQHLEDTLGEPDATRQVVVEVDRGRELVALHELGPHHLARDDLLLGGGARVAQPGANVPDVAEEEGRRQRVQEAGEGPHTVHQLVALGRDLGKDLGIYGEPGRGRLHLLLGQLDLARAHVLHGAHLDL